MVTGLLRLEGVTVRFGTGQRSHTALAGVDLQVAEGETVCVLGPSGSGKSTLLRVVAGLQPVDAGRVLLEGHDQRGVAPHRRGVGLMFQDHQLFPQHDAGANVAFGLRMRGTDRAAREQAVAELLDLVGLPGAERRSVATLSGGEQQRIALARALAPRPRVLMLDEPLGALDRSLRERLVVELGRVFRRLGTTVLAVTHDQGEAFALADRVVVMRDGRVAQSGTPGEVWQRPASPYVARFLGFQNVVEARVDGAVAHTPWGAVPVPDGTGSGRRHLLVRPAGVELVPGGAEPDWVVEARTFRGGPTSWLSVLLRSREGGPPLEAACPLREAPDLGAEVGVRFVADEVVALPGDEDEPVRG